MAYRKLSAMTAALFFAIVMGLVIYGLERNHARQGRQSELAGSVNFIDRDADRVRAELLAALADRQRPADHRRPAERNIVTTRAA